MDVLLLGPQGSGKGTQAKLISRTYGIPQIATGDMIREMKDLETEVGRAVRKVYDAGELVNDDLMIRMMRDRLGRGDTLPGFVLDGYPRTMPQAEALDALLRELGRETLAAQKQSTALDRELASKRALVASKRLDLFQSYLSSRASEGR